MTSISIVPKLDPTLGRDESSDHHLLRDESDGLLINEELGSPCDVCLKGDHMPAFCPYLSCMPDDATTVGKGWMIRCWHCSSKKIDPVLRTCRVCGDSRKRAIPLICVICDEFGHRYKTCQYKDQIQHLSQF